MKKILLVLAISISFFSNAQNYNCLQPGVKPFFTNGNGYLRAMRIDSVTVSGSDSIFHPFQTPRGTYWDSLALNPGGSWLGGNVIKQADGTFFFDDLWQDTVVIKTQAQLGDSWIFFEDTTNISYKASITAIDTMTILGVVDSIKKITIEADSNGAVNPSDPVNNFEIILSKNYGFAQVFDLYTFPYHLPGNINNGMQGYDYYLDLALGNLYIPVGASYPASHSPDTANSVFHRIPFYNPTLVQVYNFSVGEIFERDSVYSDPDGTTIMYIVDTIQSKTVTPSSVAYSITEQRGGYMDGLSGYMFIPATFDTVTEVYSNSLVLDTTQFPEEWNAPYFFQYFPQANYDSGQICPVTMCVIGVNNIGYPDGYLIWQTTDSFFVGYTAETFGASDYTFGIGQGLEAFYFNSITWSYYISTSNTFVKMEDSVCGIYTPPALSVKQINIVAQEINIFPNPANDFLNINASSTINEVTISNLLGQSVYYNNECNSDKVQINIAGLAAGIYFVKVNNAVVRKFVKE